MVRNGFRPAKILALAESALRRRLHARRNPALALEIFYTRFFGAAIQRSRAMPDGPKVGTVALPVCHPRADLALAQRRLRDGLARGDRPLSNPFTHESRKRTPPNQHLHLRERAATAPATAEGTLSRSRSRPQLGFALAVRDLMGAIPPVAAAASSGRSARPSSWR